MKIKFLKNNKHSGFVMLFAVFLSMAILSITLGVLNVSLKEINFSSSGRDTNEASLAADLGVECALYNDKSTQNKFPIPYAVTVPSNCAGIAPASFSGSNTSASSVSYDFILSGLGSSGAGCAKVNVTKDSSVPETIITSKGYNIGNSSCVSSNPNRLEREYEVHLGGVLTPPSSPVPPGNKGLFSTFAGSGAGTISSSPSGASCGTDCLSFANGTAITLTANPNGSSAFAGWGGDCAGMSCVLTMNSDRFVTANFDAVAPSGSNISFDAVSDRGVLTSPISSPVSWHHVVGSGANRILLVTTSQRAGAIPTGVTYGGTPMTMLRSDSNTVIFTTIWYLVNPASGSNHVRISYGAVPLHLQANAISFSGVHQTSPINAQAGANAVSPGPVTANLNTTTSNTWIVDVAALRTAASESITMNSMTNRVERENSQTSANGLRSAFSSIGPAASSGSYPMSWTTPYSAGCTTCVWAISSVALRESASASNTPPIADAGIDQSITLPTSSVSMAGAASDPGGSVSSTLWSFVSGPSTPTITNPNSLNTGITGLSSAGTYIFSLLVTDNQGATDTDSMQVTVSAAANSSPTANAGPNQSITLPTSSITMAGSSSDSDGTISSNLWSFVSGPSTPTITNPSSLTTGVTGLSSAGTYVFRLTATDNLGATGTDTMNVTVSSVALAVTFDSVSDSLARTATTSPSNASPISWSHTVGNNNNRILVVTTSQRSAAIPTGITYAGTPMTQMVRSDSNAVIFSTIWYLINPPVGTANIVVTYAASPNHFQGNGISLYNVNQTNPVDAQAGANALSPGPISTTITTTTPGAWIVDVAAIRTAASETISPSVITSRVTRENTSLTAPNGLRTGVTTVGSTASPIPAGAYVMSWTTSHVAGCVAANSCMWAISAVAFKP